MRGLKVTILAMLAVAAPASGPARSEPSADRMVSQARAAAKELGEKLKTELVAALKSGGPKAALAVCKAVAPGIAEDTSETHRMKVGRTALRVRNPENAPDDFERRVLEQFAGKMGTGSYPMTVEYSEMVSIEGQPHVRYMKAIPMAAEPCGLCHGPAVAPDLMADIQMLYPQDQATGFKPGELRGAFTIEVPLPPESRP